MMLGLFNHSMHSARVSPGLMSTPWFRGGPCRRVAEPAGLGAVTAGGGRGAALVLEQHRGLDAVLDVRLLQPLAARGYGLYGASPLTVRCRTASARRGSW